MDRDKIIEDITAKQEQLEAVEEELIGIEPPRYPWTESIEEDRRSFIFENMADSDIAGDTLVHNMQLVENWLKTGEVPEKSVKKGAHLRAVSSE